MNKDLKRLKSFYILKNIPRDFNYSWLVNASFAKGQGIGKVTFIESLIEQDLHEINFVWEKTETLINEELNDELEIVQSKQLKKSVEKMSIWYFEHKPFLYMFTNKVSLIKELLSIFDPDFEFEPALIKFNNDFFKGIVNRSYESEISEVSFQSSNNSQKYVISGKSLEPSNFMKMIKTDYEINNITFSFFNAFSIKAKINKSGKIGLYNLPDFFEVIDFIKLLNDLMVELGEEGLSYENI